MAIIDNPITVVSSGGGGSTDVVNGIIRQYKASTSNISANTFVEFVNTTSNAGTNTNLSDLGYCGYHPAVLISENTVFIAHSSSGSTTSANARLYGIVCTVSGTTITAGTDTMLSSTTYAGAALSSALVSENKVFITYRGDNIAVSAGSRLYGVVCTVSGTTITAGTSLKLSNTTFGGGENTSSALISENKVFIAHTGESSSGTVKTRLYGIVCTISGTTITAGTDTKLSDGAYTGPYVAATTVSENKVIVAHKGGNSIANTASRLYGVACTISGTTITAGADTLLSSTTYAGAALSSTLISENKVFITYRGDNIAVSAGSRLYGVVCTVSGTTITAGTSLKLSNTTFGGGENTSSALISENKVFIAHTGESSSGTVKTRLYGIVCTISGTTITAGTDTKLSDEYYSGSSLSIMKISDSKVAIAYGTAGAGQTCYLGYNISVVSGTNITVEAALLLANTNYVGSNVSITGISNGKALILNTFGGTIGASATKLYGMVAPDVDTKIAPSSFNVVGLTKTDVSTTTAGDIWVLNP